MGEEGITIPHPIKRVVPLFDLFDKSLWGGSRGKEVEHPKDILSGQGSFVDEKKVPGRVLVEVVKGGEVGAVTSASKVDISIPQEPAAFDPGGCTAIVGAYQCGGEGEAG